MKKLLCALIAVCCLAVFFCSDKNSVNPDDGGGNYQLEKTETIGTNGGKVETGDFVMEIPEGAFEGARTLEVYASEDERPFNECTVSRTFRIGGLPAGYSEPLKIKVKTAGSLGEESWIAVGDSAFATSWGINIVSYIFYDAEDSSGFLVTEIPPLSAAGTTGFMKRSGSVSNENGSYIYVTGVSGEASVLTEHFDIFDPAGAIPRADLNRLGDYLEIAYEDVGPLMNMTYEARKKWPFQVTVKDLDYFKLPGGGGVGGLCCNSPVSVDLTTIQIDDGVVTDQGYDDYLRGCAAHEFFHFVKSLYQPPDAKYRWFDEATSTWIGEELSPRWVFAAAPNTLNPFNGLQADPDLEVLAQGEHGYGMSTLIRYLTERFETAAIGDIYTEIRDQGSHPLDALTNQMEAPESFLENYFRKLLLGEIHSMDPSYWMQNAHGEFYLEGDGKTEFSFNDQYRDLSGRLVAVWLEDDEMSPAAAVEFSVTGGSSTGTEITVFEVNSVNKTIQKIAYEFSRVLVRGLSSMNDRGSNLLVLVTQAEGDHPYTDMTDITLNAKLSEDNIDYSFTSCDVSLTDIAVYLMRDYADPSMEDKEMRDWFQYWSEGAVGSCRNGVFTGFWNTSDQYRDRTGEIQAVLTGDPPAVYELTLNETIKNKDDDGNITYTETMILKLADLPAGWLAANGGSHVYIYEEGVCGVIVDLLYTYEYSDFTDTSTRWECRFDYPEKLKVDFYK